MKDTGTTAALYAPRDDTRVLQRRMAGAGPAPGFASAVPPIVHEVLGSPGHPLDGAASAALEPRFGRDFSEVRVHTNASAAESARAIHAAAYTVGHQIVFGAEQYQPGTAQGRLLLAHELAHVVQQREGGHRSIQRQPAQTAAPKPVDSKPPSPVRDVHITVTAQERGHAMVCPFSTGDQYGPAHGCNPSYDVPTYLMTVSGNDDTGTPIVAQFEVVRFGVQYSNGADSITSLPPGNYILKYATYMGQS